MELDSQKRRASQLIASPLCLYPIAVVSGLAVRADTQKRLRSQTPVVRNLVCRLPLLVGGLGSWKPNISVIIVKYRSGRAD